MTALLRELLQSEVEKKKSRQSVPAFLPTSPLKATRNAFLDWVYLSNLVEACSFSAHAADKLFFYRLVETFAPASAHFHPKTKGLSEYPAAQLEEFLRQEFSSFVVKRSGGMNSDGKGVYFDEEGFFEAFRMNPELFLNPHPERSEASGIITSGERYIVQEKIKGTLELRLHTLEGRVVRDATYTRWNEDWNLALFKQAEDALQSFLEGVPAFLLRGQAWGVDLLQSEKGFHLIDVNTNRGRQGHWSGDLNIPETLGAYVRHIETHYGVCFSGKVGHAFRTNQANREKYLRKMGQAEFEAHEKLKRQVRCG